MSAGDQRLESLVTDTLEQMAFLDVSLERRPEEPVPGTSASVVILRPFAGELRLIMPSELMHELVDSAGGGALDSAEESVRHDMMGEIANVLAGLYAASGLEGVELGLPTIVGEVSADERMSTFRSDDSVFYAGVTRFGDSGA